MRASFLRGPAPALGLGLTFFVTGLVAGGHAVADSRSPPGWTLDVDANEAVPASTMNRALGGASRRCLETAALDARANGFGSLFVLVDRAGDVRDARYLGFDETPSDGRGFSAADLARKKRSTFDELGACVRSGAVGLRAGGSRDEATLVIVRFVPPAR